MNQRSTPSPLLQANAAAEAAQRTSADAAQREMHVAAKIGEANARANEAELRVRRIETRRRHPRRYPCVALGLVSRHKVVVRPSRPHD